MSKKWVPSTHGFRVAELPDGKTVCNIEGENQQEHFERSRLIAAAPEMRDVLERTLEVLKLPGSEAFYRDRGIVQEIEKVLDKAKGK